MKGIAHNKRNVAFLTDRNIPEGTELKFYANIYFGFSKSNLMLVTSRKITIMWLFGVCLINNELKTQEGPAPSSFIIEETWGGPREGVQGCTHPSPLR